MLNISVAESSTAMPHFWKFFATAGSNTRRQLSSGAFGIAAFIFAHVVADARRAPHVQHGVVVVRILQRQPLLDFRIHVLQVGQLRLVELLVVAGLDLALVGRRRRHDDVVAGVARRELAVELLVAAVVADRHLDAGFLLEVRDRVFGQVVVPYVEVEDFLLGGALASGACGGRLLLLAACGERRADDDAAQSGAQ